MEPMSDKELEEIRFLAKSGVDIPEFMSYHLLSEVDRLRAKSMNDALEYMSLVENRDDWKALAEERGALLVRIERESRCELKSWNYVSALAKQGIDTTPEQALGRREGK